MACVASAGQRDGAGTQRRRAERSGFGGASGGARSWRARGEEGASRAGAMVVARASLLGDKEDKELWDELQLDEVLTDADDAAATPEPPSLWDVVQGSGAMSVSAVRKLQIESKFFRFLGLNQNFEKPDAFKPGSS